MADTSEEHDRAWARLGAAIARRATWLVAGFSVLYFLSTWRMIQTRPMWMDEIVTYYVARSPFPAMFAALRQGIDMTPPLFHILEHGLAVTDPILIRVPGMLGVWCMALCLYLIVARLRSPLHGLIALLIPFRTMAAGYAEEGRPYGLVLGAAAAALLFWQRLGDPERSRAWNLFGLWLSAAIAASVHYFGWLLVLPLLAGEIVRWWEQRRVNVTVPLVLAAALAPLIFAVPFALSARRPDLVSWGVVGPNSLRSTYVDMLQPAVWWIWVTVALVAVAMALWPSAGARTPQLRKVRKDMTVAIAGYILLPCLGLLLGKLVGGFSTRYVIGATVGLTAGLACLVPRRPPAVVVALLSAALVVGPTLARPLFQRSTAPGSAPVSAAAISTPLPIVYQSVHNFFTAHFYSPPEVARRLHFLTDPSLSLSWTGQNGIDFVAQGAVPISDCQVDDFRAFVAAHPRFILVASAADSRPWLVAELTREGATLVVRSATPEESVYSVEMPTPGP